MQKNSEVPQLTKNMLDFEGIWSRVQWKITIHFSGPGTAFSQLRVSCLCVWTTLKEMASDLDTVTNLDPI